MGPLKLGESYESSIYIIKSVLRKVTGANIRKYYTIYIYIYTINDKISAQRESERDRGFSQVRVA